MQSAEYESSDKSATYIRTTNQFNNHVCPVDWQFWGFHFGGGGRGTGVATLSSGGHTTNTFVLNYRVCNRLYQITNT